LTISKIKGKAGVAVTFIHILKPLIGRKFVVPEKTS